MRHKVLKLLVLILIGFGLPELQAQSLYVNEIVGTQTAYSLSDINKLSFSSDRLIVEQLDHSTTEYSLDSLHYLSFADSTSVSTGPEHTADHSIKAYPNPVKSELKIDLSEAASQDGTIYVLSIEGRVLQTHQMNGSGMVSIDMSQLSRGIYICRFSSEAEVRSFKIIKL